MKKFLFILLSMAILTVLVVGCSQATTPTPTQASSSSSGSTTSSTLDGKTLLETRCTQCHSLARVASAHGDASQWQQVVDLMIQQGAQLNADEEKVVVEYLAANFK